MFDNNIYFNLTNFFHFSLNSFLKLKLQNISFTKKRILILYKYMPFVSGKLKIFIKNEKTKI